MRRILTTLFATLTALGLSACYLAADGRALEADVRALEARQNEFISTFESERTRMTELILEAEQEIATLQAALAEAQGMLNRNNAGLGVRVDDLDQRIAEAQGRVEELAFQNQRLQEEMNLMQQDFEMQLSAILGGQ